MISNPITSPNHKPCLHKHAEQHKESRICKKRKDNGLQREPSYLSKRKQDKDKTIHTTHIKFRHIIFDYIENNKPWLGYILQLKAFNYKSTTLLTNYLYLYLNSKRRKYFVKLSFLSNRSVFELGFWRVGLSLRYYV